MVETVFRTPGGFTWIDVIAPSREELEQVANQYHLHPTSVQDCLDPEHLPKFERIENTGFTILRAYDESALAHADTIQELTRKVAVFSSPNWVITVHRVDQPYLEKLRARWRARSSGADAHLLGSLMLDILKSTLLTFERPIDQSLDEFERLEMGVFDAQGGTPFDLKLGYFLKRKAFVFKRVTKLLSDLLSKILTQDAPDQAQVQDVKELGDSLYFYSDDLLESVHALLNLHLSIASQRTNEVVRLLTIFSVFLLPLNVITGVYGMNFEHMPELKWTYGYGFALLLMLGMLAATYIGFRSKGWLGRTNWANENQNRNRNP